MFWKKKTVSVEEHKRVCDQRDYWQDLNRSLHERNIGIQSKLDAATAEIKAQQEQRWANLAKGTAASAAKRAQKKAQANV